MPPGTTHHLCLELFTLWIWGTNTWNERHLHALAWIAFVKKSTRQQVDWSQLKSPGLWASFGECGLAGWAYVSVSGQQACWFIRSGFGPSCSLLKTKLRRDWPWAVDIDCGDNWILNLILVLVMGELLTMLCRERWEGAFCYVDWVTGDCDRRWRSLILWFLSSWRWPALG